MYILHMYASCLSPLACWALDMLIIHIYHAIIVGLCFNTDISIHTNTHHSLLSQLQLMTPWIKSLLQGKHDRYNVPATEASSDAYEWSVEMLLIHQYTYFTYWWHIPVNSWSGDTSCSSSMLLTIHLVTDMWIHSGELTKNLSSGVSWKVRLSTSSALDGSHEHQYTQIALPLISFAVRPTIWNECGYSIVQTCLVNINTRKVYIPTHLQST